MQLTINDMPEPLEGYEYTGEYRSPKCGEWFIDPNDMNPMKTTRGHHLPRFILRKKRWRADMGFDYWFFTSDGVVNRGLDIYEGGDCKRYAIGNYFKTEAEAQPAADKLKEFFMQFHGGE